MQNMTKFTKGTDCKREDINNLPQKNSEVLLMSNTFRILYICLKRSCDNLKNLVISHTCQR